MTKHISDHPRYQGNQRLAEFTRQERAEGLHPAIEALRTRPKTRDETGRKTAEFLRIEREETF